MPLAAGYATACPRNPPRHAEAAGARGAATSVMMILAAGVDVSCVIRSVAEGRRAGLQRDLEPLPRAGLALKLRRCAPVWGILTDREVSDLLNTIDGGAPETPVFWDAAARVQPGNGRGAVAVPVGGR
eukprot:gene31978-60453_t